MFPPMRRNVIVAAVFLLILAALSTTPSAAAPHKSPHSDSDSRSHGGAYSSLHRGHKPHLHDSIGSARGSDNVRVDNVTDCALKAFTLRFATEVLMASPNTQAIIHDALELGTQCNEQMAPRINEDLKEYSAFFPKQLRWRPPQAAADAIKDSFREASSSSTSSKSKRGSKSPNKQSVDEPLLNLFVDSVHGSDSNPGTEDSPVQTLQQALKLFRGARPITSNIDVLEAYAGSITFRAGVYYFSEAVAFNEFDSYLTLQSYPGQEVVFSGGVDLSALEWTPYQGQIMQAQLPSGVCVSANCFNEMYVLGRRAVRARFPNGNPETQGLWTVNNTGYIPAAAAWLPPWPVVSLPTTVALASPTRNSKNFPAYQLGVGGAANAFDPPRSFWATLAPPAGNTYVVPGGLVYVNSTWSGHTYSNASIGFIHTFHGAYWGNWIFSVGAYKPEQQTIQFSSGGFQEARGTNTGAEWYIENLLEELDQEEEWWVDAEKGLIYLWPNATKIEMIPMEGKEGTFKMAIRDDGSSSNNGAMQSPLAMVGSQTDSILTLSGSSSSPSRMLRAITISGITFAHTSSTFMQDMEVPSGGDWSILRVGVIKLENTRDSIVQGCTFNGIGGNAIVVSKAASNTSILWNEFVWIGASAVLVAGETDGIDGASRLTYPVSTLIRGNLMHEIGIWVKQSSGVGVALSKSCIIDSNLIFNVARAGINFNDGFGGGHFVSHNLIFNTVRETDDHGPINTWDRQPFLTRQNNQPGVGGGARDDASDELTDDNNEPNQSFIASLHPSESFIHHNFLVCNYMSLWPLDHDDGSSWWTDTQNYMIYGGYKSYLGNSLTVNNNFYVLPDGKVDAIEQNRKFNAVIKEKAQKQQLQSKSAVAKKPIESIDLEEADQFESMVPPILRSLSPIMHHRASNLRKRYLVGAQAIAVRDEALAKGSSIDEALKLQSDLEFELSEENVDQPEVFTGGTVCCEDGGGYGHTWTNNTCTVLDVTRLYNLWMCDLLQLSTSIPFTAFNSLYADGEIIIPCATSANLTIPQFQKLGYEWGTEQYPQADLATMIQWGETLFGMQPAPLPAAGTAAVAAVAPEHTKPHSHSHRHSRRREQQPTQQSNSEPIASLI